MIPPVVLVCHRSTETGPITVEATHWDTIGQAWQAEAELTPCGQFCIGVHTVVRLDREPNRKRRGPPKWAKPRTVGAPSAGRHGICTDCEDEPK